MPGPVTSPHIRRLAPGCGCETSAITGRRRAAAARMRTRSRRPWPGPAAHSTTRRCRPRLRRMRRRRRPNPQTSPHLQQQQQQQQQQPASKRGSGPARPPRLRHPVLPAPPLVDPRRRRCRRRRRQSRCTGAGHRRRRAGRRLRRIRGLDATRARSSRAGDCGPAAAAAAGGCCGAPAAAGRRRQTRRGAADGTGRAGRDEATRSRAGRRGRWKRAGTRRPRPTPAPTSAARRLRQPCRLQPVPTRRTAGKWVWQARSRRMRAWVALTPCGRKWPGHAAPTHRDAPRAGGGGEGPAAPG
jgi:hypothetical protein